LTRTETSARPSGRVVLLIVLVVVVAYDQPDQDVAQKRASSKLTNGAGMANYFIFGAVAQCPRCKDHRFSGPATLSVDTTVACHKCGNICTAEVAVTTALKSGAVKKLSDHRVVETR
jgi:hypothetical protein